ncbi:MAG: response regulator [Chitinophagaceae bacterium]|nr:response regulator [Chitinophagaceae bacterium]
MNYNIILLDTDANHANLIKEHLKGYSDYTIHVFTDAEIFISRLKDLNPVVIFLDAELKHDAAAMQSETQLLFRLKELTPDSEIVLFSGEEKLELMLDQVRKGVHGFALKSTYTKAKAEMLLLSAIRHYKQKKDARFYKCLSIGAIAILILVVIFAILAYKFNYVKDDVQGPFDS